MNFHQIQVSFLGSIPRANQNLHTPLEKQVLTDLDSSLRKLCKARMEPAGATAPSTYRIREVSSHCLVST